MCLMIQETNDTRVDSYCAIKAFSNLKWIWTLDLWINDNTAYKLLYMTKKKEQIG